MPALPAVARPAAASSCYEGIFMLAALAERAGTLDFESLTRTSEAVTYESPRGELRVRGSVVVHDVRGSGAGEATPGPHTIDLLQQDPDALVEALDLGPVGLMGIRSAAGPRPPRRAPP